MISATANADPPGDESVAGRAPLQYPSSVQLDDRLSLPLNLPAAKPRPTIVGSLSTARSRPVQTYSRFPEMEENFEVADLLDRINQWTMFLRSAARHHQAFEDFSRAP